MLNWKADRLRGLLAVVLLFTAAGGARAQTADLPPTCHNSYSQQQEVELGDKVVREVYRTQPVLPDTDPVAVYVRQLGARLVAAAPLTPGLERQWPFNFHVVASSEINAFALPGGTMFVNLGAIQAADTEAQLAGVMGHEMSHVILRHSTCNLIKKQHRGILYSIGQIGAAVALGGVGGDLAAQGIGMAANLNFLQMSRGDEKQADLLGVHIVHDAGFDPRGLPQFFEIIVAKTGSGGRQFLSDHPNPGNRTEYLNKEIATLPRLDHPVVSTAAFKTVHEEAAQEHALSAAEMKGGAWRQSGLYATGPGVPAVAGQGVSYVPPGGGVVSGGGVRPSVGRLTEAQLGLTAPFKLVQGAMFAISAPAGWERSAADESGGFTLAPQGGTGGFGTAYGVVLGVARQGGAGLADPAALRQASDAYASKLMQSAGLTAEGVANSLQVSRLPAIARFLRGTSPVVDVNGAAGAERDWLVTVARPDGDMDTLIFVAPANQWDTMQPVFQRMLNSFRPQ
jgi:hypothetical protein